jgi:cysteine desulfurase family protein (TIGR01976 family)
MKFDITAVRSQFPALKRAAVYFDNPGGTQITQRSLDRIEECLLKTNANHGGAFETSQKMDAMVASTRAAVADWFNASSPDEIIFGANMTTLTYHMSRILGRLFQPGDLLVVTHLDHDANISPWLQIAEDRGCRIRWVDVHTEDGTLDLHDMQRAIEEKPRLVAFGYASNSMGTINAVEKITSWAHDVGALVYVDAVQYAPHGLIDVQHSGCDFLVASAYKFFGPHAGILYGRLDLLESLQAYKVRPAPSTPPMKFETGTGNFEAIAGILGALEYFEWVGEQYGQEYEKDLSNLYTGRRLRFKQGMKAIQTYEHGLSQTVLDVLEETPGVTVYGITDRNRLQERVPTITFTLKNWHPDQVAEQLGKKNIYVWSGNYYALAISQRLGVEEKGGMVRVGPVHYNTSEEVEHFGDVLREIAVQRGS